MFLFLWNTTKFERSEEDVENGCEVKKRLATTIDVFMS